MIQSLKREDIPILQVRKYALQFSQEPLLSEISFELYRGERLALLGLNGTGKTTFLRSLLLLETKWSGEILFCGMNIRSIPGRERARKIAWVQQHPQFSYPVTVRTFILSGRYPYQHRLAPESETDQKVLEEVLSLCHLESFAARAIDSLSGGERQRVFLAAALAQEPELLLLDEPATFLDIQIQEEFSNLLNQIAQKGTTLIEVTHQINRVAIENSRAIVFAKGKVGFDGPAANLMTEKSLKEYFGMTPLLTPHPQTGTGMLLPRAIKKS